MINKGKKGKTSAAAGDVMKYSAENFCCQARRRSRAYRTYVRRRQQSLAAKRPVIYFMLSLDAALG